MSRSICVKDSLDVRTDRYFFPCEVFGVLLDEIDAVSRSPLAVLILGETGVGKDRLAEYVHDCSGRQGAFVRVDCGELDRDLLRAELFGYEKGAFTGADRDHRGKIERADGGTLFLDEIGNMSLDLQSKLLTVLDRKCIQKIGSSDEISVDFRVIAATNCRLYEAVKEGGFREDLLYRINDVALKMPPLRDYLEKIPDYVDYFCGQFNREFCSNVQFSLEDLADYLTHDWPGNLRELSHRVKQKVVMRHFGKSDRHRRHEIGERDHQSVLERVEYYVIRRFLGLSNRNVTQTARALGLSRQVLQYKIKKYELQSL